MKNYIYIILSLLLVFIFYGCGKKNSVVVLMPNPDGTVGKLEVSNEGGSQFLDKTNQAVEIKDNKTRPGEAVIMSEQEIKSTFENVLAIQPAMPERFILYFEQNSDKLTSESSTLVAEIYSSIKKKGSPDIVVSGHTDTVGEMEHNYQLSINRARAVYNILVNGGVDPSTVKVTSHGEGNPFIKTGDNVSEPRNRRVEVVIK
ncbi:MAG: OmpA family protein [Desulfatiglans sp.]|jgi:outer membrane protein OmpA-like peptidoglycan-associated protein|nr:OmpA family protein [Desulfatiglans sp.]